MPADTARKPLRPQHETLALLDGLASQIAVINANMANLGADRAAAVRFRNVTLAAYQRAWAVLTRNEVEIGVGTPAQAVASAVEGAAP